MTVTPEEFKAWAQHIYVLCGVSLDAGKGYLIESRLGSLARDAGVASFGEFLKKVKGDASNGLNRKIIGAITTNETSFFRDSAPFELLKNKLIPDLIDRKTKSLGTSKRIPIRIWSAACSKGQEAYSMAIVLKELLGDLDKYDIQILGTDISDPMVAHASYGKYDKIDIERGLPPDKLSRHFIPDKDSWKIRDDLRALATFRNMNLLAPFPFATKFDFVFCRNVAIYFTEPDRKGLFERIARVMEPDGCLVIGSTESLAGQVPQFESKRYLRTVFYQLTGAA
jgi:chemotaxis protein methyltransferase CheR